jgi:hypothetical protein
VTIAAWIASAPITPPRKRPLFVADERTQLVGWLDPQRPIVHMKGEGLSETDGKGRMAVERG